MSRQRSEQLENMGRDAHQTVPDSDEVRRDRARGTFERAVALLLKHDTNGFAHLWAPTGTMDFPFAVGDQPLHLQGRPAIADYLVGYTDMVDVRDAQVHIVHATGDPDTLVVEWHSSGIMVATGREYRMPYVAVITVGPDGISSYRDYWNFAVAAAAFTPADPSGEAA